MSTPVTFASPFDPHRDPKQPEHGIELALNGFSFRLSLRASLHTGWIPLPLQRTESGALARHGKIECDLTLHPVSAEQIDYTLTLRSKFPTRIRIWIERLGRIDDPFHLIPANIHGDNNAAHVAPGQFPCLTDANDARRDFSPLWEMRADRASHPVSMLCAQDGVIAISCDPYSDDPAHIDGFLRNGVFAALPNAFGVALGYGNDPLTFHNRTVLTAAQRDLTTNAAMSGSIFSFRGQGRSTAHQVIRAIYAKTRECPRHTRTYEEALRALATCFADISYQPALRQYTNLKCDVPTDTTLRPWRVIGEIGWTGGSMMAYPFTLAEELLPDLKLPLTGRQMFDFIAQSVNPQSGMFFDNGINALTTNRPADWNDSTINGWWSGFLPTTCDNHCAYTNAHAVYYLLARALRDRKAGRESAHYANAALSVLDTAIERMSTDGAFGYVFSSKENRVLDWAGFAGCWFTAALPLAHDLTGDPKYLKHAARSITWYARDVCNLTAWGSPMDTYYSIDSEGNLAFLRAVRLMHERTNDSTYIPLLQASAEYEYLWRYGFRARPQAPPLKDSVWNSCGGSITSVSNPHMHPMSIIATSDLEYLARITGDDYHQQRADDGIAWIMNTMELYPDVMGYGRYGVLSERTCPSDGLLSETYRDDHQPASTWWSYNAWAGAVAMEAIAERLLTRSTTDAKSNSIAR